jgi:hypothetical protein
MTIILRRRLAAEGAPRLGIGLALVLKYRYRRS